MERASGRGPLAPDSRGLPTPKGTVNHILAEKDLKKAPLLLKGQPYFGKKRFKEGTINIVLS
jgi:hypothetical protein